MNLLGTGSVRTALLPGQEEEDGGTSGRHPHREDRRCDPALRQILPACPFETRLPCFYVLRLWSVQVRSSSGSDESWHGI
ncbi:MAG TPA: hypothetical protein PLN56_06385 [Methanoregulaceae archaeon]|nr:hypothetical protein [Methanoregulaceae archaeon]